MLALALAALASSGWTEEMIVCAGKCTSDCRTYRPPVGRCFQPQRLWPGDEQWGDNDVLDRCDAAHGLINRSFFASSNGTCAHRTDGFSIPHGDCVGPFGRPMPWGSFSCGGGVG